MINPNRLFVIDALALMHRAYWAFKDLATPEGQLTGAVYGTAAFMTNMIKQQQPDYLVVAMDVGAPTFRHQIFPEYKANRKEKEEGFSSQFKIFREFWDSLGVPVIGIAGYEADDIIGSIATQLASDDLHIYIVSGDKDFMQLMNPNVFMYRPKKWPEFEIIDSIKVEEKFGVQPSQVVDALALIGDAADNIPGVKGIGEKGAAKLIKSFGSLDGIYQNLHAVTGKKAIEGLNKSKKEAYLSQELATIRKDIEFGVSLEDMKFTSNALENDKLRSFYERLHFKSLLGDS